jgi:hypothetical protein
MIIEKLKENTKIYLSADGIFDLKGENKIRYDADNSEIFLVEINNNSFEE